MTGLDFFPTFLEAIGSRATPGKVLDGKSLIPLLTQKGKFRKDRSLYWHFPIYLQNYAGEEDQSRDAKFRTRPGSVIRKGKWKLHEYFEDGALLLYDLEKDPGETTNLADIKHGKLVELKKDLYAWRERVKAPVPTRLNPKYVAGKIKTR